MVIGGGFDTTTSLTSSAWYWLSDHPNERARLLAAPDVFHLRDEDGHAYVAVTEFTPEIIAAAKRAAATRPEQAITVVE